MSPRVVQGETEIRPSGGMPIRTTQGCVIVIFGATGDLTRRKLMPALWRLARQGSLHECFRIVGVGRTECEDQGFRREMREAVEEESGEPLDEEEWRRFAERLHYFEADLTNDAAYQRLKQDLDELGAGDPARGNHLFYFAVPPSLAPDIVQGLERAELTEEGKGWTRIVVEKPFGRDLESAHALNQAIRTVFDERQVFRIDHYLGKETVQNILAFRFGNMLFEPIWNRNYIEYVEITAAEALGVEDRGAFYDSTGALRDMVANHLLQLLTLTAMEPPVAYDSESVREEKVQVLRSMERMSPAQVSERTVRGQYGPGEVDGRRVPGYREAQGVEDRSATETFVAVEFRIENWRWAGVPFYVRTGKRLARTVTEIAIHFKRTPHSIFRRLDESAEPNVVLLRFKPDEGITLTFSAKVPGQGMRTTRVRMAFGYEAAFHVELPEAYETLLLDVIDGDPTLFTRGDEAEAQWKLISPILEAWTDLGPPHFPNYAAGSAGPPAAARLPARNGHAWRALVVTGDEDGDGEAAER